MKLRPSTKRIIWQMFVIFVFALGVELSILSLIRTGNIKLPVSTDSRKNNVVGIVGADQDLLTSTNSRLVKRVITWQQFEPSLNTFDSSSLSEINKLARGGNEVILTIESRSDFATSCSTDDKTKVNSCSPIDPSEYQSLLRKLVASLDKKIINYQIEDSISKDGYNGSIDEYANLIKSAHDAIVKVNPRAKIFTAGLGADLDTVLSKLSAQVNSSFDGVIINNFGPITDNINKIQSARSSLQNKSLFVEVGGPDLNSEAFSESIQTNHIVTKLVGALAAGADKVLIYQAQIKTSGTNIAKTLGLLNEQGLPTSSLTRVQQLVNNLYNIKQFTIVSKDPQIIKIDYIQDKKPVVVIWSSKEGTVDLSHELGPKSRNINADGKITQVDSGKIEVGPRVEILTTI